MVVRILCDRCPWACLVQLVVRGGVQINHINAVVHNYRLIMGRSDNPLAPLLPAWAFPMACIFRHISSCSYRLTSCSRGADEFPLQALHKFSGDLLHHITTCVGLHPKKMHHHMAHADMMKQLRMNAAAMITEVATNFTYSRYTQLGAKVHIQHCL